MNVDRLSECSGLRKINHVGRQMLWCELLQPQIIWTRVRVSSAEGIGMEDTFKNKPNRHTLTVTVTVLTDMFITVFIVRLLLGLNSLSGIWITASNGTSEFFLCTEFWWTAGQTGFEQNLSRLWWTSNGVISSVTKIESFPWIEDAMVSLTFRLLRFYRGMKRMKVSLTLHNFETCPMTPQSCFDVEIFFSNSASIRRLQKLRASIP